MFGLIWTLLERVAVKILHDRIDAMKEVTKSREQELDSVEILAEKQRGELIELRAELDRAMESLREQTKCIEQQTDEALVLKKEISEGKEQTSRLQNRINGLNVTMNQLTKENMNLRSMMDKARGNLTY